MKRTLVILKPDALKRWLTGKITDRLETKWLKLVASKMTLLDEEILKVHYSHLADKPFFPEIVEYMTSGPVVIQAWEGKEAPSIVRLMLGITNSAEAQPGTIRWDLAVGKWKNLMHASESDEAAIDEVKRFFKDNELYTYTKLDESELY